MTLNWDKSPSQDVIGYNLYESIGDVPWSKLLNTTALTATVQPSVTDTTRYYATAFSSSAESSPSNVFTNRPPLVDLGLNFEAEAGIIAAPFYVQDGSVRQDIQTGASDGGRAAYTFTITNAGSYTVSAKVNAPDGGADSFYVNIDAEPLETNVWSVPNTIGFETRTVRYNGESTNHVYALSAAAHVLIFRGREAGCLLDKISIVPVSVVPPQPPPLPPQNLRATAVSASRIDLTWLETTNLVRVERALTTPNFTQIGLVLPGNSFYIDTGLHRFTKYFYRVQGQDSGGSGPYSPIVSERTLKR